MSQADSYGDFEETHEAHDSVLPGGFVIDGKYAIKRLLGSGGSGSVYEAEHAMIGHRVAIKVVHSSHRQRQESLARFRREAKICGAIRHPHVGQIYDVGALEDGTPFMVMELHDGRSLGDILEESILPIAAVVEVTRQILAGLAAVHHAGAIHRDVKPDNAMIVRASSGDLVVKLVDFGISKVVRADIRERALTREDIIIGSPDYMAPEQLRGQEVDERTDLYAVGVLLYEAVTGCLPFNAENLTDLMAAIVRDPVTPPSVLRTDCPAELEHLILKAMSRDPADRFQSADEMSRQLAHVQRAVRYAADPGLTRLQEPMPPRHATTRRARGLEAAAAAAPAVAAAGPSGTTTPGATGSAATPVRRRAMMLAAIAAGAALAGGLLLTALRPAHGNRDRVTAPVGASVANRATAPDAPRGSSAVASGEEAVTGSDHTAEAARTTELVAADATDVPDSSRGSDPAAVRPLSKRTRPAKSSPTAASETEDAPSVRALLDEAASAFVLGQMPKARSLYQQVLERQPAQAEAWRGLGLTASQMGQRKDAEHAFERYLKLRPKAPDAARIREQLDKVR